MGAKIRTSNELAMAALARPGRYQVVKDNLQDLNVGGFTGDAGTFAQTTTPTPAARTVLAALAVQAPKKVLMIAPAVGRRGTARAVSGS